MYTNRPSKQQQKKGLQLMKGLMMSQKKVNQVSSNNINNEDQIWSSTSLKVFNKNQLNQSSCNGIDKNMVQSSHLIKLRKKDNPQMVRTAMGSKPSNPINPNNPIKPMIMNWSKLTLKQTNPLIESHQYKTIKSNKRYTDQAQSQLKTQTNQTRMKLYSTSTSLQRSMQRVFNKKPQYKVFSKIPQKLFAQGPQSMQLQSQPQSQSQINLAVQLSRSLSKQHNKSSENHHLIQQSSRQSMQQQYLPLKGKSSSHIQIPKLAPHYRQAKQKTTLQNIYKLQTILLIERQEIKIVRKDFMDVLENGKKLIPKYQKDHHEINSKQLWVQNHLNQLNEQTAKRHQHKLYLQQQLQTIQQVVSEQQQHQKTTKSILQQQILQRQQENSRIARKIYQLKTHLHSINQQKHNLNKIQHNNKSLIKQIIKKQQQIHNLKLEKQIVLYQQKLHLKQSIKQEIQNQDKTQVYNRLDTKVNLIKEYFKISQNSKQFRRTIKKLTKLDSFNKEIQKFTKSPTYSDQIMMLYRTSLWNTQMPKFFESQPLILESPKIRLLKNTYKQLQLKRQSLNEYLKEKQKVVDSLTYRCQKLVEQIQHLHGKKQKDQLNNKMEMSRLIDWGF